MIIKEMSASYSDKSKSYEVDLKFTTKDLNKIKKLNKMFFDKTLDKNFNTLFNKFELPEKWYIRGNEKLSKWIKEFNENSEKLDGNILKFQGSDDGLIYYIDNDTTFNCKFFSNKELLDNKGYVEVAFDEIEIWLNKIIDEYFEKIFLDLLDYTKDNKKIQFLDEKGDMVNYPTNRYEIRNSNNEWLFDISYNSENPHFWYSYHRIYLIFNPKFNLNYQQINYLMKGILEKHSLCKGVTPYSYAPST